MTITTDLLQQHIQTLIDDNSRWQMLLADDILQELAYAPSLGHPVQLVGRAEAVRHATWFAQAVENFRFTGRMYRQDYVAFLRAVDGTISFLREYFDPVRAARALDTPMIGLES